MGREAASDRNARIQAAETRLTVANDISTATAAPPASAATAATTATATNAIPDNGSGTASGLAKARNARIRKAEAQLAALVSSLPAPLTATGRAGDAALAHVCVLLRQALVALGGATYLIRQGEENPRTFLTLIGKLMPGELRAEAQGADSADRGKSIVVVTGVPDADDDEDDDADHAAD